MFRTHHAFCLSVTKGLHTTNNLVEFNILIIIMNETEYA